jgi:uncharacterized SAM-binding protein YcdF (DUF218 family)
MSLQALLTTLVLPPFGLLLVILAAGAAAWRGWRAGGAVAVVAALALLVLGTPYAAGMLVASLEHGARPGAASQPGAPPPRAIIVLAAEAAFSNNQPDVGPLTLERLRAGAVLRRRTGLPLLVTGGPLAAGDPPIATLMARSLIADFGQPTQWVEPRAGDTRENAAFSAAMLRAEGIQSAYLVTHGWHMPRAREAFARLGFTVVPVPVRLDPVPEGHVDEWIPRADYLAMSWFAMREWLGRLVYALRD